VEKSSLHSQKTLKRDGYKFGFVGEGYGRFFEKKLRKKLYTIGIAELYKAKVAGQCPAALSAPANAGKTRK